MKMGLTLLDNDDVVDDDDSGGAKIACFNRFQRLLASFDDDINVLFA